MMNYVLLIFNFSILTIFTSIQTNELNYVSSKSVMVVNQIGIGSSINDLVRVFGKPDSITEEFDLIVDETPTQYYHYKNTYFELKEGDVTSFNLANELFSIVGLRAGDSEVKLSKKFPKSYSNKYYAGEDRSQLMVRVGLLTPNGLKSDAYYLVFYLDNNMISSINYWENP